MTVASEIRARNLVRPLSDRMAVTLMDVVIASNPDRRRVLYLLDGILSRAHPNARCSCGDQLQEYRTVKTCPYQVSVAELTDIADWKRFFRVDDDGGAEYHLVADNRAAAEKLLTDSGCEFGDPSLRFDQCPPGAFTWKELTPREALRVRCNTDEDGRGRGTISLLECDLGEWFSSEW